MSVSVYYLIEQGIIVVISLLSVIISSCQFHAHRAWKSRVRRVHQLIHPAMLLASINSLIWSVDPRSALDIYPWYVQGFMKDTITCLLFLCGTVWLTQVARLLFEVNNKKVPPKLEFYSSTLPSMGFFVTMIVCDAWRIVINRVWPIGIFVSYLAVTCFGLGVFVLLCFVSLEYRVRPLASN